MEKSNALAKNTARGNLQTDGNRENTSLLPRTENTPSNSGKASEKILFKRLHDRAILPVRNGSAFQIHCCDITESGRENRITLPPHSLSRPIPTGLRVPIPFGGVWHITTSRSALGSGILVLGSEGLGGSNTEQEVKLFLFNTHFEARRVMHGDHLGDLHLFTDRADNLTAEWYTEGEFDAD